MGRHELAYPKEPLNTVKRHNERGDYSLQAVHSIINSCSILHVSFNDPSSPFPVTLPMIGQMGSFARPSADVSDPQDLYLHGYVSSRIMNLARKQDAAAAAAAAADDSPAAAGAKAEEEGMPVTVSGAHLDGLVLSLTPFNHSYNYRSAVLFGHATLVTDDAEKKHAMELITNGVVPHRWDHLAATSILRVKVASGSAKVRDVGCKDDKQNLDDAALVGSVWTGVVPVYQVLGTPVPTPYSSVEVPAHVTDFVRAANEESEAYATSVSATKL